jgi:hypothetical protein
MACSGEWLPHLVVAEYMTSKHLFFFASIYFTPMQTHACAGVIQEQKSRLYTLESLIYSPNTEEMTLAD